MNKTPEEIVTELMPDLYLISSPEAFAHNRKRLIEAIAQAIVDENRRCHNDYCEARTILQEVIDRLERR